MPCSNRPIFLEGVIYMFNPNENMPIEGSKHDKVCQKCRPKNFNFKNSLFSTLKIKKTLRIYLNYILKS
jgi:hypothetical protein